MVTCAATELLVLTLAACGGDDGGATGGTGADNPPIEVTISPDTSPIVKLRDVTCGRVDDDQLVASGIVTSSGDDTHYVNLQIRFVDGDGVRVELASDSVSELQVGESARWDTSTYADGAPDVDRCEVTATVG